MDLLVPLAHLEILDLFYINSDCLAAFESFLHHMCTYLGIFSESMTLNVSFSLEKFVRHISFLKANVVQDAAKIEALHKRTNCQITAI